MRVSQLAKLLLLLGQCQGVVVSQGHRKDEKDVQSSAG